MTFVAMSASDWKRRGYPCPCCGSKKTEPRDEPDVSLDGVAQNFLCEFCEAEWEVCWTVSGFDVSKEPDRAALNDHFRLRALAAFVCFINGVLESSDEVEKILARMESHNLHTYEDFRLFCENFEKEYKGIFTATIGRTLDD